MITQRFLIPAVFAFSVLTGGLTADVDYEIHDIGTSQTYCSNPIAINDAGEILGWFDVGGSGAQHYGLLRRDTGRFSGLPLSVDGMQVDWKFLVNDGSAYGIHVSSETVFLFVWNEEGGAVNLGKLPGNDVVAVNDSGQVLIKSMSETLDGEEICYPVLWENGKLTKLKGLPGDLGVPSSQAFGLDLNNHGVVVGHSQVSMVYKNQEYVQTHATMWVNGEPIDLHRAVPKQDFTKATAINDQGDIWINKHLLRSDGSTMPQVMEVERCANESYFLTEHVVFRRDSRRLLLFVNEVNMSLSEDHDSIWLRVNKFVDVNSSGDVIAMGTTIYGESHAVLMRIVD